MADWTIKITGSDPNTGKLTLDPPGDLEVVQGDTVLWQIESNSGVSAITKISEKPMSFDLFKPDPTRVKDSSSWKGTVNPDIGSDQEEKYFIEWSTVGGGWLGKDIGHHKFDPTIKINPRQTK